MQKQTGNVFILISCTLASFLTPFMSSSINVALPVIAKEFSMDSILLSWVSTVFLLSAAIFLVPLGRIADIYGRKRIFKSGIILYAIVSGLLAVTFNQFMLLSLRVVQGIGGAMIFGTSVAILTDAYPQEKRGKAMGILVTAVYFGSSIGPIIGGYLTQQFGWRSLFILNSILALIAIIFVLLKFDIKHEPVHKEKFDWPGSIIYGISLASLMYGFSKIPDLFGIALSAAGLAGIILFFVYEKRNDSPVLNVNLLLTNKVFAFSNLAALINYCATFGVGFLNSLYLQYNRGLSPKSAGLILVTQPLVMAIFSPFAGRLSDKIEPRILATIGMSLTAVSLLIFSTFSEQTNMLFLVLNLILIGLGFALFSSPNINAIMSSIEKKHYGVGSATQSTMRLVGQMFSMGIVMLMFSIIMGRVQIVPQIHQVLMTSIKISFLVFSILCLFGVYLSLIRGNLRNNGS